MTEWREFKLREIAEFNPETLTVKNNWKEINYLDTGNITRGVIDTLQVFSFEKDKVPSRAKRIVRSNDIVYSTVRPNQEHYGLIKVPTHNMIVSTGFTVIQAKNAKCDSGFLYYFMTLPENTEYLSNVAEDSTTAYPSIKPDVIMDMDILLPLVPEQQAIAEILSSLDDKIDLLNRQNTTLEALAETYFRQWFVEEADENWEEEELSNLIDVRDGTHDSPKSTELGYNLITSKHLNDNHLDFESSYKISKVDFDNINLRSKVDRFDILISMIGTIGRIYFVTEKEINFAIKNIGLFKTSKRLELRFFLYLFLKSPIGKQIIKENCEGSTQEYIALGSLRKMKIIVPQKDILEEFNYFVDPLFGKVNINTSQIQTLQKLRDTLLPKLISGEVKIEM